MEPSSITKRELKATAPYAQDLPVVTNPTQKLLMTNFQRDLIQEIMSSDPYESNIQMKPLKPFLSLQNFMMELESHDNAEEKAIDDRIESASQDLADIEEQLTKLKAMLNSTTRPNFNSRRPAILKCPRLSMRDSRARANYEGPRSRFYQNRVLTKIFRNSRKIRKE